MNNNTTTIVSILAIGILLITFFGYTYYADADAILQLTSDVESINQINPKITSTTITFTLNITNPTNRHITDLNSEFNIFIENNEIGKGSFSELDIPSQSSVLKQVTITVFYNTLADSVVDIIKNSLQGQDSELTIKGTMNAAVLFGLTRVSQDFIATST